MISKWFPSRIGRKSRHQEANARSQRPGKKLTLEVMEDRLAPALLINEILFNPPAVPASSLSDTNADYFYEYIELRNTSGNSIPANTYLVAVEGDSAENPGDVQDIFALSSIVWNPVGTNNYFAMRQDHGETPPSSGKYSVNSSASLITQPSASGWGLGGGTQHTSDTDVIIENGSVTFFLVTTGTAPTLSDDIDGDNDGTPDGSVFAGWTILDAIGASDGGASDRLYGVASGFVDLAATQYVGRYGTNTGTASADWVGSSSLGGAAPNWTMGASPTNAALANSPLDHIGQNNRPYALEVSILAASIAENAGNGATTVTITRPADNIGSDLIVNLVSDDTLEATIQATATILANQTFVTVNLNAADDTWVDGTVTVTITATAAVAGYNSGSDTVNVTDNESLSAALATYTINSGASQRSMVRNVTIDFNVDIDPDYISTVAASITIVGQNAAPSYNSANWLTATASGSDGINLTFTGAGITNGSLADGRYDLQYGGNTITAPGNGLFRIYGDYNGNSVVDNSDLVWFRKAFADWKQVGGTYVNTALRDAFDYDGDGFVNNSGPNNDYAQFLLRLYKRV